MIKQLLFLFFCLIMQCGYGQDFTVSQDGKGDFKTIQEAINAVPEYRKVETKIYIKNGIYKEKINIPHSKQNIHLIGEDKFKTILTFDDFAQKKNRFGEDIGTSGSASIFIFSDDFKASNLTFENSAGPVGQAVAVRVSSDRAIFDNCRFLGFQDTLYTYQIGARQFYYKCYIEGTVDFIFGSSTAWFEQCELFCKQKGYITAASTPDTIKFGYVFNQCKITGEASSFYLGRPWRPYAKVIFMNSSLPSFIEAQGWNNWGKESNEQTTYYVEYNNSGSGAAKNNRVKWAHQLNKTEAQDITLAKVFGDWDVPSKYGKGN